MDQYSNNELRKYNDARRMHKAFNIRCRKHSQAPSLELTCSTCHERKPHEDFSNAQRKEDTDRRRCRICVDYTETIDLFQNMPVRTLPLRSSEWLCTNATPPPVPFLSK